jgi:hypothetical protein
MKTIYLDGDFKCYTEDDGTRQPVQTDVFDHKCDSYIRGCRLVPQGKTWTREDGEVFCGIMVSPWADVVQLDAIQRCYEQLLLEDMETALDIMEVRV